MLAIYIYILQYRLYTIYVGYIYILQYRLYTIYAGYIYILQYRLYTIYVGYTMEDIIYFIALYIVNIIMLLSIHQLSPYYQLIIFP